MLIKHSNHYKLSLVGFSLSKHLCIKQDFFLFAGDRNPPQSGLPKEGSSLSLTNEKFKGRCWSQAWLDSDVNRYCEAVALYLFVLLTCLASFSVSALSLRWLSVSPISYPQRLTTTPITGVISALGLASPGTNAHPNIETIGSLNGEWVVLKSKIL